MLLKKLKSTILNAVTQSSKTETYFLKERRYVG